MLQVNNAGLAIYTEAKDCKAKDWSLVMSTNLEASFHISQLAYPLLKASGNGSVVFVSSASGVISTPGSSLYGTSKGNHISFNSSQPGYRYYKVK